MTRYQAIRISRMIQNGLTSQEYHDAYGELLKSCSDSEPCLILKPQPTVTISGSSTATPPPPSTPKPLGPEWWKERQAEALQEQIDIIADKNLKIETLNNQVALLMKRIKEDREHWDNKAVIDNGIREHNNELVAANGEIYEALRHWGLEQSEPCSLVNNVKHVIQLCAERGNRCDEQEAEIKELKKDRNASIIASNQILGALNQTSLRQYDGSLADNVVDVINQCVAQEKKIEILDKENYRLEKHIENLKSFSRDDQDINHRKTVEIEGLKKQLVVAGKKRQAIVEAGNKLRDRLRIMGNQYFMPQQQHVENSNAIALWEDNTTP